MSLYPQSIQKLIEIFKDFPGIGPRQATRFIFYLLKKSQFEIDELVNKIQNIKTQFHYCPRCFAITDNSNQFCLICNNSQRDKMKLCVVEKDSDIQNIENAHIYNGLYFIVDEIDVIREKYNNQRINELKKAIKNDKNINEIIIATNPTVPGDAAAAYIERDLKPLGKKISRLGRGLPSGGEIEYADEITLKNAFKNRE